MLMAGTPAQAPMSGLPLDPMFAAMEQVALEGGKRWELAWLLSHLPEPPWHRFHSAHRNRGASGAVGAKFSMLADPSWVATAMAYINDCAKLDESRKRLGKGAGKGKKHGDEE